MNNIVISVETLAVIQLAVLLYGVIFETKQKSRQNKAFAILIGVTLVTIAVDALSYLPIDWATYHGLYFCLVSLTFILPFAVCATFVHYMYLHMMSKAEFVSKTSMTYRLFQGGVIYCLLGGILMIVLCFTNQLFRIEEGRYVTGRLYTMYLLVFAVLMLYVLGIIFYNYKKLGLHDTVANAVFVLIPFISVGVNLVFPEAPFEIVSISVSLQIINVMTQADRENRLMESEVATSRLAHYDELTGLLNRLAFSETVDSMSGDQPVGVVFCDVNGLKYTNDHYGHKAGDALLCDLAKVLLGSFRKDDVFRISGDEFVVLLIGMPLETFERKTFEVRSKLVSREIPIASSGFVHGSTGKIERLLDLAEAKMYENKKEFYKHYPLYDRDNGK